MWKSSWEKKGTHMYGAKFRFWEKINSGNKIAYFYAYEISMVLIVMESKIAYVPAQCGKTSNKIHSLLLSKIWIQRSDFEHTCLATCVQIITI